MLNKVSAEAESLDTVNSSWLSHLLILEDSQILNESLVDWNGTSGENYSSSWQSLEHAPSFKPSTLIKGVVLLILGLAALLGNVATLISITRRGRQHSSTVYLLLLHLSVADLVVTVFCIVGEAFWTLTVQWYGGDFFCKLFKFLQMLGLYLSTFILVVIGFDRLCAIRFPMRRIKARMNVRRAIVGVWALSSVLSAPQAAIFRVAKGPFLEEFYQCVTYGFYTAAWQEQLYTSISLFCMFIVPLCILVATYATTFATIVSKARVFGGPLEDSRRKLLRKAKIKSLWITVVIVLTFIVCWTPYYVSMVISVFLDPDDQLGQELHDVIFFFGSSTAVLNPIIYGAFHLRKNDGLSSSSRNSSRLETSLSILRKVRTGQENRIHTVRVQLF